MIERLTRSLQALRALSADDLASSASARLRDDCADALRLELDCPQQSLSPNERSTLLQLNALLDDQHFDPAALAAAVRRACDMLSLPVDDT